MVGQRVEVAGRRGQLNGYNVAQGRVWLWDEDEQRQVELWLAEGQEVVVAPLTCRNGHVTRRLFADHRDPDGPRELCADCVRLTEKGIHRHTPCDDCGAPSAWRDPFLRTNVYRCGSCHVKNGRGVVQNKWFARVSEPLRGSARAVCEAAGVGSDCKGEVKPRGRTAALLCNAHAGKVSAGEGLADRSL